MKPLHCCMRTRKQPSARESFPLRSPTPLFAPLNTPIHRRIETAAVLAHLFSIPFFLSLFFILVTWILLYPRAFSAHIILTFLAIYGIYYVRDFKRPFHGNVRPWKSFLRFLSPWLKCYRAYFPVKAVLTLEAEEALDGLKENPRPIMFGSHPHGIVSIGTVTNFILDPDWFCDRFPHIDVRLLTLNMNMIWPFWRDWMMALGFASVDRISCEKILAKTGQNGESRGITIVIGGAKEALDAVPGRMDLTLNSRNGFFKLALKHGALLFPVINFGENDIYDQLNFGVIRIMQRAWQKIFGFSTPFFFGRGIFNYRFGWLPRRVPITTVIGPPIDVAKIQGDIHCADVQKLRQQYIDALTNLYEEYKGKYEIVPCPKGLRIVR